MVCRTPCRFKDMESPAHCRIHPISLVVEHLHGLCIAFRIGINKEDRLVTGCHDVAAVRCPCRILPGTGRCDCPGGRFVSVRSGCHDEPLTGLKRGPAKLAVLSPVGMSVLATLGRVAGGLARSDIADVDLRIARLVGNVRYLLSVRTPACRTIYLWSKT